MCIMHTTWHLHAPCVHSSQSSKGIQAQKQLFCTFLPSWIHVYFFFSWSGKADFSFLCRRYLNTNLNPRISSGMRSMQFPAPGIPATPSPRAPDWLAVTLSVWAPAFLAKSKIAPERGAFQINNLTLPACTSLSWSWTFLILLCRGVSDVILEGFPFAFSYFSLYFFWGEKSSVKGRFNILTVGLND